MNINYHCSRGRGWVCGVVGSTLTSPEGEKDLMEWLRECFCRLNYFWFSGITQVITVISLTTEIIKTEAHNKAKTWFGRDWLNRNEMNPRVIIMVVVSIPKPSSSRGSFSLTRL
jgi:hypothetical protein